MHGSNGKQVGARRAKARRPFAHAVLFPLAALYAASIAPWWAAGVLGIAPLPPGLETAGGHGHEMLFGFALAVVAGYLLGPQPLARTLALAALWALARLGALLWPGSLLAVVAGSLFAAGVAALVVPRFARAAKKWRNRALAPAVLALAAIAIMATFGGPAPPPRMLLVEALIVLCVLMFFMGGRILAPAVAGHLTRQGYRVDARVQPRLEAGGLIALALALLAQPLDAAAWLAGAALAGAALVAAGALTLLRLARWRPWAFVDRPDLLTLALGQGWLGAGLVALGVALPAAGTSTAAAHMIGIGALGTLTLAVMARTRLLLTHRDANAAPAVHWAALAVSAAALARLAPWLGGDAQTSAWLALSAGLWSGAFATLLVVLLRSTAAART